MFSRQLRLFENEDQWDDGQELREAVHAIAYAQGGVIRSRSARALLIELGVLPDDRVISSRRLYRVLSRSEEFVRVKHGEYRLRRTWRPDRDLTAAQKFLLDQLRGDAAPYTVAASASKKIGF